MVSSQLPSPDHDGRYTDAAPSVPGGHEEIEKTQIFLPTDSVHRLRHRPLQRVLHNEQNYNQPVQAALKQRIKVDRFFSWTHKLE